MKYIAAAVATLLLSLSFPAQAQETTADVTGSAASVHVRAAAAGETARKHLRCLRLDEFYWEIGDSEKTLARGWVGNKFREHTDMEIGSAGKWLLGAYAVQKLDGKLTPEHLSLLRQTAGFGSQEMLACQDAKTIGACQSLMTPADPAQVGKFYDNIGGTQKLAVDLGLGDFTGADLSTEYARVMGADINFYFVIPVVAEGMTTTPASYAQFLRRILGGDLKIKSMLEDKAICATPGEECPDAIHSPMPKGWGYSLHHWVEGGETGDGAFSAPGEYGFYPWIDNKKQFYGIVARKTLEEEADILSTRCGKVIRKAWDTGVVQDD
jgi:hypothetical protein